MSGSNNGRNGLMSQKNAKQERKAQRNAEVVELKRQIEQGTKERKDRLEQSKQFVVEDLKRTAEEFGTVLGYQEAATTFNEVLYVDADMPDEDLVTNSLNLAVVTKQVAEKLAEKVAATSIDDLSVDVVGDLIDYKFTEATDIDRWDVAKAIVMLKLVRIVQEGVGKHVEFRESTDEALKQMKAQLATTQAEDV